MSSILQSLVAYFIGRNRSAILVLVKKWPRMHQILLSPNLFRVEHLTPPSSSNDVGPLLRPAFTPPLPPAMLWQWQRGVLQATTGELLPTFCKGSSTLFSTEKAVYYL